MSPESLVIEYFRLILYICAVGFAFSLMINGLAWVSIQMNLGPVPGLAVGIVLFVLFATKIAPQIRESNRGGRREESAPLHHTPLSGVWKTSELVC